MASSLHSVKRPLSPHLQVYRWTWTMGMSIAHRVTGSALVVGTLFLAIWLVALATSPQAFNLVHGLYGSLLGQAALFFYSWILLHHMLGGIRHLIWDTGYGYKLAQRMNLARGTLILSTLLTIALWAIALSFR